MEQSWTPIAPGELIASRYRVDAVLGTGGYGSVYRCKDLQLQREVAVKVLHSIDSTIGREIEGELRDRFAREARIMGQIQHPNFVQVYDVGMMGRLIFLVMELVNGRSLGDELARGVMTPARALPLFIDALQGLGEGHARGVVHKDLKPDNLLLTRVDGHERLKLLDFGVARVVHEDRLTRTGLIVGTPQYFAPEYLTTGIVSPAVDVYQMALILIEALAGRPCVPDGLSFIQMCNVHDKGRLEIPVELTAGDFGYVIRRATAISAADRYHDAAHFAQALRGITVESVVAPAGVRPASGSRAAVEHPLRDLIETLPEESPTEVWGDETRRELEKQLAQDPIAADDEVTSPQSHLKWAVLVAALIALGVLALAAYLAVGQGS